MLSLITTGFISMLERELVKHSPEIQAYILNELHVIGKTLMDKALEKLSERGSNHG
jgi:hypothetical protein